MKTLYILFVISLVFISCDHKKDTSFNKKSIQGTWLVQAIDMDTDYYKPNTLTIEFKGDSLCFTNLKGEVLAEQMITFSKDSISLDTIQYPIDKFKVIGDRLQFFRNIAHRIESSDSLNIKIVAANLVSNYWKNDNGVYHFDEVEKVIFTPNSSEEYSTYCYEVFSYDKNIFLQKKGNQLGCDRDYQFIEQILSISNKEMVTYGFVDGIFKKIIYNSVPKPTQQKPANFQLCNQYLNKNYPRDRYYYQGTEYKGGLYHIRKIFAKQYKAPQDSNESGIFQVRFVVNCEGEAGMFESQAFDNEYQLKEFSPAISNQILHITKGLQDWKPGRTQKTNLAIDTYIYISYKIKDGKIIRIYP